uniref:Uncharacterized protein n=1 Tax=Dicentrarchus labrax TaxID=13489 RepID=A0A8P4GNG7_DICLA
SLINADLKILSKVLASRLEVVTGKIVNPDQTGFIKGRLRFGYLSGYKVNLSALMLINTDQSKISLPPQIKVSKEVIYLGIRISNSLSEVAKTNYSLILKKIEEDINRWRHLPASIPARISVIKINVLPRIHFISSMLPLAPSTGYWQKLDCLLRRYVWNGKHPSIKWSALQCNKKAGGLACPNFKLYHWALMLKSLSYWFEDDKISAWKVLTGVQLPMEPALHLLNDDSQLSLGGKTRKIWLCGPQHENLPLISSKRSAYFLLPVGGAITMSEYCHVHVFRAGLLSSI